jgi:hypothetical protein
MLKTVLALLLILLLVPAVLVAQEGDTEAEPDSAALDTIPVVRTEFTGDADQMRNWGTMESDGQLQTTLLLVPELSSRLLVNEDDFVDSLVMMLTIDLTKLTTGFPEKDSLVLSKEFLDFDTATVAVLNILSMSEGKEKQLLNEQSVKTSGTAELYIGGTMDTVAVTLQMTYLQGNKVTEQRLPGNLLHVVADYSFRLSDFGIKIPKDALLRLDDRMKVHTDMFLSSPLESE